MSIRMDGWLVLALVSLATLVLAVTPAAMAQDDPDDEEEDDEEEDDEPSAADWLSDPEPTDEPQPERTLMNRRPLPSEAAAAEAEPEPEPEDQDEAGEDKDAKKAAKQAEKEAKAQAKAQAKAEAEAEAETEAETPDAETKGRQREPRDTGPKLMDPMTPQEVEVNWRKHRVASIVGLAAGGGATAAGVVVWGTGVDATVGQGLVTGGAAGLFPGVVTLTGSLVIDGMAGKTGRSKEDLYRWKSGLYRACLGAGLILAGSFVQYLPIRDAAGDPTLAGYHVAGALYGVVGGVLMAEGYATAEKGLWYPRPMYGLTFVTAALLIVPKAIDAGTHLSPATWDYRHGVESLGWVGAGVAMCLIELAATTEHRQRSRARGGRATLDRRPMTPTAIVVPWTDPTRQGSMGLSLTGTW